MIRKKFQSFLFLVTALISALGMIFILNSVSIAEEQLNFGENYSQPSSLITPSSNENVSFTAPPNSKFISALNQKMVSLSNFQLVLGDENGAEDFKIINLGDGKIALKSTKFNTYVCADKNLPNAPLVANRNECKEWEMFYVIFNPNNSFSLKAIANDYYVSISDSSHEIVANKSEIEGAGEEFYLSCLVNPQTNQVQDTIETESHQSSDDKLKKSDSNIIPATEPTTDTVIEPTVNPTPEPYYEEKPGVLSPTEPSSSENYIHLYTDGDFDFLFDLNISGEERYQKSVAISKDAAFSKKLIKNRIDRWWDVLTKHLPFKKKDYAYAFFMGDTALETTFNMSLVTGGNHTTYTPNFMEDQGDCAHAIGLVQVAETGFKFAEPNKLGWVNENVEGFPHAPLEEKYFYDPAVNMDMGIRKMCHFAIEAADSMNMPIQEAAKSPDFWALVLKGHNTGHATYEANGCFDANWWNFYAKTVGTAGNFLLTENHMSDDVITYNADPRLEKYNNGGKYLDWIVE